MLHLSQGLHFLMQVSLGQCNTSALPLSPEECCIKEDCQGCSTSCVSDAGPRWIHFPVFEVQDNCVDALSWDELRNLLRVLRGAPAVPSSLHGVLARRAVKDYRAFVQNLDSGHQLVLTDPREVTWWFWGAYIGERPVGSEDLGPCAANGGVAPDNGPPYADRAFFEALAPCAAAQLEWIHPIMLVYMLWTFTKADVKMPGFFQVAGDYLLRHLEKLDRCSIGMAPWCFAKMRVPHPELFQLVSRDVLRRECAAENAIASGEAPRPADCLAPRVMQNLFWSFARHGTEEAERPYCEEMIETLQKHARPFFDNDPGLVKFVSQMCPPYISISGAEVHPDPFRLMSCAIMAQACVEMEMTEAEFFKAMADYVVKGLNVAPESSEGEYFISESGQDLLLIMRAYAKANVPRKLIRAIAGVALQHVVHRRDKFSSWGLRELHRDFKSAGMEPKFEQAMSFCPAANGMARRWGRDDKPITRSTT